MPSPSAAITYATGGYHVVLDGIIGPWFLDRLLRRTGTGPVQVDYVMLRPARRWRRGGPAAVPGTSSLNGTKRSPPSTRPARSGRAHVRGVLCSRAVRDARHRLIGTVA